jgi:hypothetical protein
MSNDNYILQLHDLDKAGGLGVSDQQTAKRKKEPNYKIQTGFSLTRSTTPFTFSISETIIYFGTLFPTNPIKRTNKLTVSNGSANGYLIIAFEDKELSALESSAFIPDTTCDNGLCSEARSAAWTNPLTYGFGYRCDNVVSSNCAKGFSEVGFYKQFANNSKSEIPHKVVSGTNGKIDKIVQITYKVNISGAQQFAFYNNTITYIAVPNF